jgi:hypothetical protein
MCPILRAGNKKAGECLTQTLVGMDHYILSFVNQNCRRQKAKFSFSCSSGTADRKRVPLSNRANASSCCEAEVDSIQ